MDSPEVVGAEEGDEGQHGDVLGALGLVDASNIRQWAQAHASAATVVMDLSVARKAACDISQLVYCELGTGL